MDSRILKDDELLQTLWNYTNEKSNLRFKNPQFSNKDSFYKLMNTMRGMKCNKCHNVMKVQICSRSE